MSSFGRIFKITTFGESHSSHVGVTIENFPPKFKLNLEQIQQQMNRRRPGQSHISTPRNESDSIEIITGNQAAIIGGSNPLTPKELNRNDIT